MRDRLTCSVNASCFPPQASEQEGRQSLWTCHQKCASSSMLNTCVQ
jgi:hypothetical protein